MKPSAITGAIVNFGRGMAIGVAQIIPGVSGGTLALIMGIYERFIGALNAVSSMFAAFLGWMKGFRKERWVIFTERFRAIEWVFLILLASGMLAAILLTSGLITWLLDVHQAPTYGFFFGLIVASVIVPWEKMERRRFPELMAFLLGLLLLLWVSGLGKDLPARLDDASYQRAHASVLQKADRRQLLEKSYIKEGDSYTLITSLTASEKETLGKILQHGEKPALWFLFIAGAVSVSAMILPGLSGSFVLLVMGCYGYVVGLINLLKTGEMSVLLPLGVFALGLFIGLFSFARLMEYLLEKFHSITMAFLIGLMLGSLRKIFPFQSGVGGGSTVAVIAAIAGGIVIVLALHLWSRKQAGAAA